MTAADPLVDPPPVEVPLQDAPLVRVIAQVRFPLVIAIEGRELVAPFQEAIRKTYPVLRQEQTQSVTLSPLGGQTARAETTWRFADLDQQWRVSLAPGFLALETTAYSSRSEFLSRLADVVGALDTHIEPKLVDRLGLRYIDRISGKNLDDITHLIRPEVRGVLGAPVSSRAQHSLTESLFALDRALLVTRWGRLPAGATVDAAAIEAIGEPSWILDLDLSTAAPFRFDVGEVKRRAGEFAERIYAFFRWAVTEEFLSRYGGEP